MSTLRTKASLCRSPSGAGHAVSHSHCPLIKLQPCSLLSCWQTKVLKRTPSVIASNLRHNVAFHVNWSERKGSCCSLPFFHPLVLSRFYFEEPSLTVSLLWFVFPSTRWETFIVALGKHFDNVKVGLRKVKTLQMQQLHGAASKVNTKSREI